MFLMYFRFIESKEDGLNRAKIKIETTKKIKLGNEANGQKRH